MQILITAIIGCIPLLLLVYYARRRRGKEKKEEASFKPLTAKNSEINIGGKRLLCLCAPFFPFFRTAMSV